MSQGLTFIKVLLMITVTFLAFPSVAKGGGRVGAGYTTYKAPGICILRAVDYGKDGTVDGGRGLSRIEQICVDGYEYVVGYHHPLWNQSGFETYSITQSFEWVKFVSGGNWYSMPKRCNCNTVVGLP